MAAAATAAAPPTQQNKTAKPVAMNRFVRGSTEHVEPFYDSGPVVWGANPIQLGPVDVVPFGWARNILVQVIASGGSGATTVTATTDAPWAAIQNIQYTDVNGTPTYYLLGYEMFLSNKWGYYEFATDPALSPNFSAVATGASASGNFQFMVRLPLEIRGDGLGALPNGSSASTFKVLINLAGSADIYGVAPTNLPSLRVKMWLEAWQKPAPADVHGTPNAPAPPANGTTQFWSRQTIAVGAGQQTLTLKRVGNLLRELILIFRQTAGNARDSVDFPDPIRISIDSQLMYNFGKGVVTQYMWERTGMTPDTGVFVLDWVHDGGKGTERSDLYLPTSQATNLQLEGLFGTAGTLIVLTNDIKPAANLVPADGNAIAPTST